MGLDQYAYVRAQLTDREEDGHTFTEFGGEREFTWRKHSRLQEFMLSLWTEKGNAETFNCQPLELTEEDLLQLQRAIDNGFVDFVCDGGFFWGHQFQKEAVDESREYDLEFVTEALEAVRAGERVIYSCWW